MRGVPARFSTVVRTSTSTSSLLPRGTHGAGKPGFPAMKREEGAGSDPKFRKNALAAQPRSTGGRCPSGEAQSGLLRRPAVSSPSFSWQAKGVSWLTAPSLT